MTFQRLRNAVLQSKWRVYAVSIGHTLVMAPQYNLFSLQSSIGVKNGLGSSSVALYGVLALITLLLYGYLVKLIGRKNCLVYGEIPSVIFTLSFFYPRFWTVAPSGALIGMADSIISPALGVIIISLATTLNESSDDIERRNSRIGIFLAVRGLGQAIASIVPEVILHDSRGINASIPHNASYCGANDCPLEYAFLQSSNIFGKLIPTVYSLRVYLSVFCAAQIIGIVMHVMVIPNDRTLPSEEEKGLLSRDREGGLTMLKTSFLQLMQHMTEKFRLLTILTHLQHGMFTSYIWSEIGRAYVSCTIGVGHLGLFTFLVYVSLFLANLVWNKIGTSHSLAALYSIAFVLEVSVYMVSLFWKLSESEYLIYLKLYLFAVLLGTAHNFRKISSYSVTINYFQDLDSAYLVQTGMGAFGNAIVFIWATVLCVYVKIYILLSFSALATILVLVADFLHRSN